MQHPCSHCGAEVDNSLPYCPTCEAPQVRFVPREPEEQIVQLRAATASPSPVLMASPTAASYPTAAPSDQGRYLRAAAYAGAIGCVLCLVPFGPFVALPLAGWLAVRFYARNAPSIPAPSGFRLGALAGLFAFGMLAALVSILVALSTSEQLRQALMNLGRRAHDFNPDIPPEQYVNLMTPSGVIATAVFLGVFFAVLAGLGGLIAAVISGRRRPS